MNCLRILFIVICLSTTTTYGQEILFSKNGTQKMGSSLIDTIIDTRINFKKTRNRNFIFRHIDNIENPIKIGRNRIVLSQFITLKKSDHFDYFFLLNIGKDSIEFTPQDESLMTVTESINEKDIWKPTQFWIFSDCGNSYIPYYKITNGQILIIKAKRSYGDYKTKQRLRFKTYSNKVIVSDPYFINIDLNDFFINENDYFHRNIITYRSEYFSYLSK